MSTVLVVEDEADLRLVMETLLGIEGYDVIGCETGESALERVDEADVILLDIRLPGISGLDVVEQLSHDVRRRVLFMSAHADMERQDLAGERGCAGFLVKPFDFDELCSQVRGILEPA